MLKWIFFSLSCENNEIFTVDEYIHFLKKFLENPFFKKKTKYDGWNIKKVCLHYLKLFLS